MVPASVLRPLEKLGDSQRILTDDPRDRGIQGITHEPDQWASGHLSDPRHALVGVDLDDCVCQTPHPPEPPGLRMGEGNRDGVDIDTRDLHEPAPSDVTFSAGSLGTIVHYTCALCELSCR